MRVRCFMVRPDRSLTVKVFGGWPRFGKGHVESFRWDWRVFGGGVEPLVAEDDGAAAEHRVDQLGGECLSSSAEEPCGVSQPGASVQVRFDRLGGNPAADHQGECEDPPGAVPDRAGGVVDKTLG